MFGSAQFSKTHAIFSNNNGTTMVIPKIFLYLPNEKIRNAILKYLKEYTDVNDRIGTQKARGVNGEAKASLETKAKKSLCKYLCMLNAATAIIAADRIAVAAGEFWCAIIAADEIAVAAGEFLCAVNC